LVAVVGLQVGHGYAAEPELRAVGEVAAPDGDPVVDLGVVAHAGRGVVLRGDVRRAAGGVDRDRPRRRPLAIAVHVQVLRSGRGVRRDQRIDLVAVVRPAPGFIHAAQVHVRTIAEVIAEDLDVGAEVGGIGRVRRIVQPLARDLGRAATGDAAAVLAGAAGAGGAVGDPLAGAAAAVGGLAGPAADARARPGRAAR